MQQLLMRCRTSYTRPWVTEIEPTSVMSTMLCRIEYNHDRSKSLDKEFALFRSGELAGCHPFCTVVFMEPRRVHRQRGSFYESRSLTVFAAAKMSLLLFRFISRISRFGCELL